MTALHVLLPEGIDDPARPSGGNHYDRRICDGLTAAGWAIREHVVPGRWPRPDGEALAELATAVATIPDDALLLVDGLIGCAAPAVLVPASRRLRLVVLVHMPLGAAELPATTERAVLTHASAVVTTSAWTRDLLLARYPLDPDRVAVVQPGAEQGPLVRGTADGGRLLCVAALAPHKGQDVLVAALAGLDDADWRCAFVGPLDRDPAFVNGLRRQIAAAGIEDRIRFRGACDTTALRREYAQADLVVLPSRREAYGMVVTEALAVGLPVVATDVGGVPEAVGTAAGGPPGLLVPPGDPIALRTALAAWLGDADLRRGLRRAALERRGSLQGWDTTTHRLAAVLAEAAAASRRAPAQIPG